tara:strand:- start:467 stop:652 length:186 start_codon:yes stop_codon:yes gene_type:complete
MDMSMTCATLTTTNEKTTKQKTKTKIKKSKKNQKKCTYFLLNLETYKSTIYNYENSIYYKN